MATLPGAALPGRFPSAQFSFCVEYVEMHDGALEEKELRANCTAGSTSAATAARAERNRLTNETAVAPLAEALHLHKRISRCVRLGAVVKSRALVKERFSLRSDPVFCVGQFHNSSSGFACRAAFRDPVHGAHERGPPDSALTMNESPCSVRQAIDQRYEFKKLLH